MFVPAGRRIDWWQAWSLPTQSEASAADGRPFGSRQSRTGTIVMPMKRLYARVDGKKPTSPPQSKTSQGLGL